MSKIILAALFMVLLVAIASASVLAQTEQGQAPGQASPNGNGDPIRQLNLTPEQREQIRLIREQNREERAQVAQRVRETNRALEELLNGDNPDQALVEQRLTEASAAQAAAMRVRILNEVKIRRVLSQEQRAMLRTMRTRRLEAREDRRLENLEDRQQRREDRSLRLREQRRNAPAIRANKRRPIL